MLSRRRPPASTPDVRVVRPVKGFTVDLPDGRRVTGRIWPGDGDPLVLVHGLFDSSEGWVELARGTGRPCVAVDLPGFGGSDLPAAPRIASYAADVAVVLDELGVERATLVGHSLGGAVAAAVAERSSAIASLVLLAPAGFGRIRAAELVTRPVIVDLATLVLPLALVNPLVVSASYMAFVGRGRLPGRSLVTRMRASASRAPSGVRAAVVAIASLGRERQRRLDFHGPVGVLWGVDDVLVPAGHAGRVLAAFPQAEVELWPGMGHHPQQERLDDLIAFVERYAGEARTPRTARVARAARVAEAAQGAASRVPAPVSPLPLAA
ncbi:MAG TPA: alpha/beta fold hydrolase [Baekduia sp.]|nr:alpha/beta fold hydrolase [Baekduia sp.]